METPLLEVRNLTKAFPARGVAGGQTIALDSFSMTLPADRATITTIAGESGSGKTTLANLILGFLTPTAGEILYGGHNVWRMSRAEWLKFRREVQAIFQDPYEVYNPFYKVDTVFYSVIDRFGLAKSRQEARSMIVDAIEVLGLRANEVLGKHPHQLSGGQRQRIMVARAFLLKPRLIIADEPVSMVDASLRALILENMLRLKNEFGISFLYITHDLSTAYQISDDIFIMYLGSVAETGGADAVIQSPQHPYTRALVGSIPDPDRRWEGRIEIPEEAPPTNGKRRGLSLGGLWAEIVGRAPEVELVRTTRCRFADRCPYVTAVCQEGPPPLYEVGHRHQAACYLFKDAKSRHDLHGGRTVDGDRG